MRKFYIILILLPVFSTAQNRLVLNNNGYINIENSAYLVIDNDNANAVTVLGTGGNIISEDETDVVKWNISSTVGTYIIPWTTSNNIKIPQELDITTPGSVNGSIIFSTYETATDMNAPYPSAVTNMNYNGIDKSLYVADRFWHTDARSYTTMPSGNMVLHYDPAPNELGITNTITETNLLAQRFNTTLGHWESYILLGVNDAGNDRVTSIPFSSTDFFQDWILVDNTNPLPVTLLDFDVTCENDYITISWSTASEINNDYFVVEKSYDAVTFFELETVPGAGNSYTTINYVVEDNNTNGNTVYYRLKQVDFDDATTYYDIKTAHCIQENNDHISGYFSQNELIIDYFPANPDELKIALFDIKGKLVFSQSLFPTIGKNRINLGLPMAKGLYVLKLQHNNFTNNIKLVK